MNKTCTIVDCNRPSRAKNMCEPHYRRFKITGVVGGPIRHIAKKGEGIKPVSNGKHPTHNMTPEERLWHYTNKTDDCWLYEGRLDRYGYGKHHVYGKDRQAYKYAYELLVGPVPDGMELDHTCVTPACINPDHLDVVTHDENMSRRKIRNAKARMTQAA